MHYLEVAEHQAAASLPQALCAAADIDAKATRAAELRKTQRQALLSALTAWPVDITGHEGYMKVRMPSSTSPPPDLYCCLSQACCGCKLFLQAMRKLTEPCAALQAEVTGGGIPLNELNCATCESRKLPVCLSTLSGSAASQMSTP